MGRLGVGMKIIASYDFDSEIEMPMGAQILSVDYHQGCMQLWAVIDRDKPMETRYFERLQTGDIVSNECPSKYLGMVARSTMVWHILETSPNGFAESECTECEVQA